MTAGGSGDGPAPAPPELQAAIDTAAAEHLHWLQSLARALLWPGDTDARADATDPAGGFAGWVAAHREHRLVAQPTVLEAAGLDQALRRDAARLLAAAADGPPPRADFDRLMQRSARYQGRLTRLAKAFAAASAELDPLTGLRNRTTLERLFHREAARLGRSGGVSTVALLDLDHFKRINDRLGHAAGDTVLRHVADRLAADLRPYDVTFRYGGEEFLILFVDSPPEVAGPVLERLRQALESAPARLADGGRTPVTASFGAAALAGGDDWQQVLARADQALYRAKRRGRNRVEFWLEGDPEPDGGERG